MSEHTPITKISVTGDQHTAISHCYGEFGSVELTKTTARFAGDKATVLARLDLAIEAAAEKAGTRRGMPVQPLQSVRRRVEKVN